MSKPICDNCKQEVNIVLPMGLFGECYHVCKECKDSLREKIGIKNMSFGMQYYFEHGVDKFPESNADNW